MIVAVVLLIFATTGIGTFMGIRATLRVKGPPPAVEPLTDIRGPKRVRTREERDEWDAEFKQLLKSRITMVRADKPVVMREHAAFDAPEAGVLQPGVFKVSGWVYDEYSQVWLIEWISGHVFPLKGVDASAYDIFDSGIKGVLERRENSTREERTSIIVHADGQIVDHVGMRDRYRHPHLIYGDRLYF